MYDYSAMDSVFILNINKILKSKFAFNFGKFHQHKAMRYLILLPDEIFVNRMNVN